MEPKWDEFATVKKLLKYVLGDDPKGENLAPDERPVDSLEEREWEDTCGEYELTDEQQQSVLALVEQYLHRVRSGHEGSSVENASLVVETGHTEGERPGLPLEATGHAEGADWESDTPVGAVLLPLTGGQVPPGVSDADLRTPLAGLPDEIWNLIYLGLSQEVQGRLAQVSKRFNEFVHKVGTINSFVVDNKEKLVALIGVADEQDFIAKYPNVQHIVVRVFVTEGQMTYAGLPKIMKSIPVEVAQGGILGLVTPQMQVDVSEGGNVGLVTGGQVAGQVRLFGGTVDRVEGGRIIIHRGTVRDASVGNYYEVYPGGEVNNFGRGELHLRGGKVTLGYSGDGKIIVGPEGGTVILPHGMEFLVSDEGDMVSVSSLLITGFNGTNFALLDSSGNDLLRRRSRQPRPQQPLPWENPQHPLPPEGQ